jgi:hypothetical protein
VHLLVNVKQLPHICFSTVMKVGAQPVTISFHAFKADFWVLTSYRFVGWHYCYREICCFHLQDLLQCLPVNNSINCEDGGTITPSSRLTPVWDFRKNTRGPGPMTSLFKFSTTRSTCFNGIWLLTLSVFYHIGARILKSK